MVVWRATAGRSMNTILISSKALSQLVEEQFWAWSNDSVKNGERKRERGEMAFLHLVSQLSISHSPSVAIASASTNAPFFVEVTHKDPFLSSPSSLSHLLSPEPAWTPHRDNTNKGKNKAGTQSDLEDDEVPEEGISFPRTESSPETPGTSEFV